MPVTPEQIQAEIERRKLVNSPTPTSLNSEGSAALSPELQQRIEAERIKRNLQKGNEFTRAVPRGLAQTSALVTEGVPAYVKGQVNDIAETLGYDAPLDPYTNLQEYEKQVKEANIKYPARVGSFKDIHSVSDAGSYVAAAAGEQVPQLGMSLLFGGLGGVGTKMAVQKLAERGGRKLTEAQLSKAMTKGILGGTLATSASQNIPETYLNLLSKGEDAGTEALIVGGLKSGLDVLPEIGLLKKLLGPVASDVVTDSLLKRMGKEGVKYGIAEGVTESAQEGLDIIAENFIAENQKLFSDENLNRIIDSGLKGAIGGSIMGAGAAPFFNQEKITNFDQLPEKEKEEANQKFMEETVGEVTKTNPVVDSPNLIDDTIVTPTYLDEGVVSSVKQSGVNAESLSALSQPQVQELQTAIEDLSKGAKGLKEALRDKNLEKFKGDLVNRKKRIKKNAPRLNDTNFIPGDGVIVAGAHLAPEPVIGDPATVAKTSDMELVAKTVSKMKPKRVPKTTQSPIGDFSLPKPLSKASPNFGYFDKNWPLAFESDVDRALYIVGQKTKSKSDSQYRNWLKTTLKVDDTTIDRMSKELKEKTIKPAVTEQSSDVSNERKSVRIPKTFEPKARTQLRKDPIKQLPHTLYGNLNDDIYTPSVVANNIQGVDLTPAAQVKYKDLVNTVTRIVKEVAGPKWNVDVYSKIGDVTDPSFSVAGVQILDTVSLAINPTTEYSVIETAYHESWHSLERLGVLTQSEKQILDQNTDRLIKYFEEDGYLKGQDFQIFLSTPTGREELRANAFGKWSADKRKGVKSDTLKFLPPIFNTVFNKLYNMVERVGNAMRGLGFKSFDDIFTDAYTGGKATSLMDNVYSQFQQARLQRMNKEFKDAHEAEQKETDIDTIITQARINQDYKTQNTGKTIGFYGKFLRSFADSASKHPFVAQAYDTMRRKLINGSALLHKYSDAMGGFSSQPRAMRFKIYELADYLRNTGQKAKLDKDGYLTYERDGKVVRIPDKEVANHYMNLQNGYAQVLNDYEDVIKEAIIEEFKEELGGVDPTVQVLQALAQKLPIKSEVARDKINNFIQALNAVQNMRKKDFVPRMRFGSYGIVVKDKKTKEQVAFYTVESGEFNNLYNKYQMDEIYKQLKKYSNTEQYEIVGSQGVIKNLDSINSIKPFKMTYAELKNHIDPRYMNIEMLSSLLAQNDMDVETYAAVRQEVFNDILTRGFKNRFSESKEIEGYSRDWDRVHSAYFSGAAHYIAGIPAYKETAILQREALKLQDQGIKNLVTRYLEYASSPQEDFQMLRTFNFLWTMGGNLSSGLLQLVTLPTTTLGAITQYSPNVLRNMQKIGKWFSIANAFFASKNITEWLTTDFSDQEVWDSLIKSGKVTKAQAAYGLKMAQRGTVRGMQTQEYTGYRPYETRSRTGSIRSKGASFANVMGAHIGLMEQMTRFATTMAAFDIIDSNPLAKARAEKILANDYRFQAQVQNETDLNFNENVAAFTMDEAHAVFGKVGRPAFMRSVGGALFFPFMTYPQQAIEFLIRMANRGNDGRRGLLVTLGALYFFSGMLGLPGAELLKELIEEIEKQVTGSEEDLDLLFREKIYDATGDAKFAKFMTQGFGRAYLGLDVSKRIGLPIPGQDILLSILGIRGQPSDVLGVQGSLLMGMGDAWNEYNQGGGITNIAQAITPVAASNLLKAYNYSESGVQTKRGMQLVAPEDVTKKSYVLRAMGITSDQIASKREERYGAQLLDTKYTTGVERYRSQAKKLMTQIKRAQKDRNFEDVSDLQQKYKNVIMDVLAFARKNQIPFDLAAFNRSVQQASNQRVNPELKPKDVRKHSRKELEHLQESLGIK